MKLIQDKDTQMRIDGLPEIYRTVRKLERDINRLADNYTKLCAIVASIEGRLEKHIEMSLEPQARLLGNFGFAGGIHAVTIPVSSVLQMLLNHLNLELVNEQLHLKEIVDDDKA